MEDEDTHGKKMARKGRTEVIYKGTFVSERSLDRHVYFLRWFKILRILEATASFYEMLFHLLH